MKRTKINNKTADAILCADFHLREDPPVCRTDDFWETQWRKVQFIADLQIKHDCPVLHAGDLFHHWKPSPRLISYTIENIPDQFYTVLGNHDLPQHNIDLLEKCGLYTLYKAKSLNILPGIHFGNDPKIDNYPGFNIKNRKILVWHIYTYQTKTWPGNKAPRSAKLLRKYPEYDLILTGDNHQAFVEEHKYRLLVNPGSLMRQDADQIDFRPRIYLYYADTNTVEPVYLPIEPVISREHLINKEEHDNRLKAFVRSLNYDPGVRFEDNMERFFANNRVHKDIKQIYYKSIEL
ncbi:MAG: metallophosphoesterase family protein [Cyclobacteriaceae bacterium]